MLGLFPSLAPAFQLQDVRFFFRVDQCSLVWSQFAFEYEQPPHPLNQWLYQAKNDQRYIDLKAELLPQEQHHEFELHDELHIALLVRARLKWCPQHWALPLKRAENVFQEQHLFQCTFCTRSE